MVSKIRLAVVADGVDHPDLGSCGFLPGLRVFRCDLTALPHAGIRVEMLFVLPQDSGQIIQRNALKILIPGSAILRDDEIGVIDGAGRIGIFDLHLVSAGSIHYEPFGIYAGKSDSLDELADGAEVLVPNDVTNEARALLLLQDQGLLTLKEDAGLTATINDITENPKNLDIVELEAAQLPRSLQDADIAFINGNYAIEAGLKVTDALAVEASDSLAAQTYGNVVAVREGDEESDKTKALMEVLTSDDIKEFIETKYDGAVVPLF